MSKKASELMRKRKISRQTTLYVSNKDLLKVVRSIWNVRSIYDKLHFDDILLTF